VDHSASGWPQLPPGLVGIFLVALVGGLACYMLLFNKPQIQTRKPGGDQSAEQPLETQPTPETSANAGANHNANAASKKRSHRRHHAR
jgi:hypothetical protein